MGLNIGTGKGTSVRQAIEAVEAITGLTVPTVVAPRRNGDPAGLVSDPSKAEKVLRWKPRLSSIEEIISTAWLWHQTRAKGDGAGIAASEQRANSDACSEMVEQN